VLDPVGYTVEAVADYPRLVHGESILSINGDSNMQIISTAWTIICITM